MAINGTTGSPDPWTPPTFAGSAINSLVLSGQTLYVGGNFYDINGVGRNRVAAIILGNSSPDSWDPNVSGPVNSLLVTNNSVLLGGQFISVGGTENIRTNFAQLSPPLIRFGTASRSGPKTESPVGIGIDLSSPAAEEIQVSYVAAGNATRGVEYTISSNSVTIPVGSLFGEFVMTIDGTKTFSSSNNLISVTLSAASGAMIDQNNNTFIYTVTPDASSGGSGGSGGNVGTGGTGGSGTAGTGGTPAVGGSGGGSSSGGTSGTGGSGGPSPVVDKVPPVLSIVKPLSESSTGSDVMVQLTTNEEATCSMALDQGVSVKMSTTGTTSHLESLLGLKDGTHTLTQGGATDASSSSGDSGGCSCSIQNEHKGQINALVLMMSLMPVTYLFFRRPLVRVLCRRLNEQK
ncbi:MAG: hypothetical protein HY073_01850 [Deltaproteobacteria bacterium]|nr:hypothetical protein [Deltaproteobacteria bacterium]